MPILTIQLDGDGAWPDLKDRRDAVIAAVSVSITGLAGGMRSGRPSVMMRIDLPDGRVVIYQTSLALFLTAAEALKARYGDPRN